MGEKLRKEEGEQSRKRYFSAAAEFPLLRVEMQKATLELRRQWHHNPTRKAQLQLTPSLSERNPIRLRRTAQLWKQTDHFAALVQIDPLLEKLDYSLIVIVYISEGGKKEFLALTSTDMLKDQTPSVEHQRIKKKKKKRERE